MMTLARYDATWLTLVPFITTISICIAWSISFAHLLVPFVHRLSLADEIALMTLLGRGVEAYPWPVEEAQIRLIADQLMVELDLETADRIDQSNLPARAMEEKCKLVVYDLV